MNQAASDASIDAFIDMVFNFPQNRLVDGPLQIEARIDQYQAGAGRRMAAE